MALTMMRCMIELITICLAIIFRPNEICLIQYIQKDPHAICSCNLVNCYTQTYPQVFRFLFTILQRFHVGVEHTTVMSNFIVGLLDKLVEESCHLQAYASRAHELQTKTIADFQKAYEVCFQAIIAEVCAVFIWYS